LFIQVAGIVNELDFAGGGGADWCCCDSSNPIELELLLELGSHSFGPSSFGSLQRQKTEFEFDEIEIDFDQ
jgi:hypothetical protein